MPAADPPFSILAAVSVAGFLGSGESGADRTTVGRSGEVSVTRGLRARSSLMTTVTLSRDCARVPSGAIEVRPISCEPGASGGGTKANKPDVSAMARAWLRPLRRRSTVAPGAPRPAITLSPFGSIRTTSKDGVCALRASAAATILTCSGMPGDSACFAGSVRLAGSTCVAASACFAGPACPDAAA